MRIVKRIVVGIVVVAIVLVGISYLLPRQATVFRSVEMKASPEAIYPLVSDLRRFNEWSPWFERDPLATYTFTGPADGVGQTMNWESKDPNVGAGSQAITRLEPGKEVEMQLDFGRQGTATGWVELVANGPATTVTWGFKTDTGFNPIARYFGLAIDRMVGPDFEKGLAKLKSLAETQPASG
jgi:hypothetical protein